MFMQHEPNPAGRCPVAGDECDRTITSAPSNTCARCMLVLVGGLAISSAGEPYTVTVPGVLGLVRNSESATATALPTGTSALCWSPCKSRLVPDHVAYSAIKSRITPSVALVS